MNTLGRSKECLHFSTLCQLVFLFVSQFVLTSHFVKCLLQTFFVEMQFYRHLTEIQLQRSTIINRVLEGIFRHISTMILIGTKALKCILIALIDRRTSQSKEECIRQGQSHAFTKVSFLCTMGLIHQHHDIISDVQCLLNLTKQEDGGNQYLTLIFGEKLLQLFASISKVHILNL